jgi:transposase
VVSNKKKARRMKAWIVFQDESGVSQRPSVRRTWSPRGETPILIHAFNWKKMSIAAALSFSWDGKRSRLYFQTKPDSYNSNSLIGFLRELKRELRGTKCILIWDGLPAHKSKEMKAYLSGQHKWLRIEVLPGYAPDINPVEMVWGNVKGRELANLCPDDFAEVGEALKLGLTRVGARQELAYAFLHHAGLFF